MKASRRLRALAALMALALVAGLAHSSGAQTESSVYSSPPQEMSSNPAAAAAAVPPRYAGSVPVTSITPGVLALSLRQALDLALRQNLGIIFSGQESRTAEAERLESRSKLLPDVTASVTASVQQNNLAQFGISVPGVPRIVGPFGLSDARAYLSQRLFDWNAIQKERASSLRLSAARFSQADAREIVVLVVANQYLDTVATEARVAAAQSQLATAQSAYDQAASMRAAGMVAGIDVLRAQVELESGRQRLLLLKNEFEKKKLDLAREIGLPQAQAFSLADKMPYAPAPFVDLPAALEQAYRNRADYQRALALASAAERARAAARAEAYPDVRFDGNYGDLGHNFANSHGTFAAAASLQVPIFQGGKVKADVLAAQTLVEQRRAELADLKSEIESEVRKTLLDVQSAAERVQVTRQELELASQALSQSRDRFAAGVADNLEVVQAQEAVANANQDYISSVYAHNIAKASLARAVGVAEKSVKNFLEGNP